MIPEKYAKAYTEVVEILKYVPSDDVRKIPQDKIDFYKDNMDTSYCYRIDETINFEEQELSEETKSILANIYRDYWATEYQKKRIKDKERYDIEIIEEEKQKKYNPDDIFKKNDKLDKEYIDKLPVKIKKERFINRLMRFLKKYVKKK
ncbi:MAG: hypothetical protein IJH12_10155 [Clostridia bacterium]|nr:hypothetical protein [Clostridia bacterium]